MCVCVRCCAVRFNGFLSSLFRAVSSEQRVDNAIFRRLTRIAHSRLYTKNMERDQGYKLIEVKEISTIVYIEYGFSIMDCINIRSLLYFDCVVQTKRITGEEKCASKQQ